VIVAKIYKAPDPAAPEAPEWAVEVDAIDSVTEGYTRQDAMDMLVDLIEGLIELELKRPGVKVRVTHLDDDGPDSFRVIIEADEPALLGALVLRHQRQAHGLTVKQVAERLGAAHHNAYTSYELGQREPSIGKFAEMLAAISPELRLAVTVGPRKPAQPARPQRKTARQPRQPKRRAVASSRTGTGRSRSR
jgi:transcriptional regulator with XRE-family HTH domain